MRYGWNAAGELFLLLLFGDNDASANATAVAPLAVDAVDAAVVVVVEVAVDTPESAAGDPPPAAAVACGDGLRVWRIRRLRDWSKTLLFL